MTLAVRLEKLRFITGEMAVALVLARRAPDSFVARTLARHIVIRARDFIEHARQIRKPLIAAGYLVVDFHAAKESYAQHFAEYFQIQRDKIGAHVQDFDFWKRIELWNDIEVSKIGYFVDGAAEVYVRLGTLNIPGYQPYVRSAELNDPALEPLLANLGWQRSEKNYVEISSDALAATRDNTSATFSGGPLNARAAQLALIKRWIDLQKPLLERFAAFPDIVRVIRARIITDIVSFCDALVTRPVSATAPQAMDGLDKLIVAQGGTGAAIKNFVAISNFDAELAKARAVRDAIGAHLEVNDAVPLSQLLPIIDGFDMEVTLKFFDLIAMTFRKACMEFPMLRLYAADGQRIHGVTPSRLSSVPFSADGPEPALNLPTPHNFDDEMLQANLVKWLDGDEDQKADARQYFWNAFLHSPVIETITETEHFENGYRNHQHEYRRAHQMAEEFLRGCTDEDYFKVLDLVERCRSGAPYALVEVLLRSQAAQIIIRQAAMCRSIGEIGSLPHNNAEIFLDAMMRHPIWSVRLEATIALFKMFIRSEGLHRINKKNIKTGFGQFVGPLKNNLPAEEKLVVLLGMASVLSGHKLGTLVQPFKDEYEILLAELEALCEHYLVQPVSEDRREALKALIAQRDFVGVAVLLMCEMKDIEKVKNLRAGIIEATGRHVIDGYGPQAARHHAMALIFAEQYELALQQARYVAESNPDNMVFQTTPLTVLYNTPGAEQEALKEIARIRSQFKLDAEGEKSLADAEAGMRARLAASE